MVRGIGRLPATYKSIKTPGMHCDGGGLYLEVSVSPAGNLCRSWIFRFQMRGRARDMGLGSINDDTLAEAREAARQCRKLVKEGIDPIEDRKARVARNLAANATVMTFDQAAEIYMRQHSAGWSPDHAAQWASSLKSHVSPIIGKMSIRDIATTHVVKVLEPMWREKTETASRLRGRLEAVLGWATVSGYRSGDNPARWRGHLDNLLALRSKVRAVEHHAALPYAELPAFMVELYGRKGMAALALEFAIRTCVRSADVFNAKHSNVDRAGRVWTIPSFSKTRVPHRVPLSDAALVVFDKARKISADLGGDVARSEFAFPNDLTGTRLSQNAMWHVLNRMGRAGAVTTHGFRATFRTWSWNKQTSLGNCARWPSATRSAPLSSVPTCAATASRSAVASWKHGATSSTGRSSRARSCRFKAPGARRCGRKIYRVGCRPRIQSDVRGWLTNPQYRDHPDDLIVLCRLVTDPRMRRVWKELRDKPPAALKQFLFIAYDAAWHPRTVTTQEQLNKEAAKFSTVVDVGRPWIGEQDAKKLGEMAQAMRDRSRKLGVDQPLTLLPGGWRPPLIVLKQNKDDDAVRAYVLELSSVTLKSFGVVMLRTIATTTSVALQWDVTARQVQEWTKLNRPPLPSEPQ